MSHSAPPAGSDGSDWTGRRIEVAVTAVAHGGHCVARHDGRVLFVRHALPGELVVAEVTEDRGGSFCRADAVQILQPAPGRVPPPCPQARPGGCGGCDFQHATADLQRQLKAAVVAEQFHRLAGLDVEVTVEPLGEQLLGWRRRVRYAVGEDGGLGLRAHRSHRVIALSSCPLGAPGVGDAPALPRNWAPAAEVEVAVDDDGQQAVLALTPPPRAASRSHDRGARRRAGAPPLRSELVAGPPTLHYTVAGHDFHTSAGGFWQTHPAAAETYTAAVLAGAALQPGEAALDLYCGAGLFTVALAAAVGPTGRVRGLEAAATAVTDAASNLAGLPWARVDAQPVTAASVARAADELGAPAVVVLDPPRTGAGREVMTAVLQRAVRAVIYVACDPAALARDVGTAQQAGWRLTGLRAFDAFPMTHHVECVAVLHRDAVAGAGPVAEQAPYRPGDQ